MGFEHDDSSLGVPALSCNVEGFTENRNCCKNQLAIMWTERFAVIPRTSKELSRGKYQEWVQLNDE
jgi:hypothetical protein